MPAIIYHFRFSFSKHQFHHLKKSSREKSFINIQFCVCRVTFRVMFLSFINLSKSLITKSSSFVKKRKIKYMNKFVSLTWYNLEPEFQMTYSSRILKLYGWRLLSSSRLDFSLSWLKGKVRGNLGDFWKDSKIITFLSLLPLVPIPFTKQTYCTMILIRMQSMSLE
jgi:hypothetical protein